jgi:hypothetical protein
VKIFKIHHQISLVMLLGFFKDQFKIPASSSVQLVDLERYIELVLSQFCV